MPAKRPPPSRTPSTLDIAILATYCMPPLTPEDYSTERGAESVWTGTEMKSLPESKWEQVSRAAVLRAKQLLLIASGEQDPEVEALAAQIDADEKRLEKFRQFFRDRKDAGSTISLGELAVFLTNAQDIKTAWPLWCYYTSHFGEFCPSFVGAPQETRIQFGEPRVLTAFCHFPGVFRRNSWRSTTRTRKANQKKARGKTVVPGGFARRKRAN